MEFHEKLQELRKQRGLTQEELAEQLYVSRAAVSKWESGRGYPNVDSLRAIAKLFGITLDTLLSADELLTITEVENDKKVSNFLDLTFGLLDLGVIIFCFLPIFAQRSDGVLQEVSLFALHGIAPYLRIIYLIFVGVSAATGILSLALQNCRHHFWLRYKYALSIILSILGVALFILSSQPYGACIWFLFLLIKALLLWKNR